ncbi:flagellar motor switch protein FliM [Schlesneria paludicola]|uniref:flagellar motor switch protein FliM n=1 Tax=Schlesneria paludicola TaxID=360056 RepID=UPI000299EBED|nr:FliM/FliN family flagellar motor switch protein [Schlesneria paludicola]
MGQILSQSEVEAILSAVNFPSAMSTPQSATANFGSDVSLYDFEHPEPLRQSQLDTLRRLALANRSELETRLKSLLRAPVRITFLAVEQSTFRDYLATSEHPGCLAVLEASIPGPHWLLDVGRTLSLIAIDCMLGGQADADQRPVDHTRPFTEVEVKLLKKAFAAILPGLISGLAPQDALFPKQIVSDATMLAEATANDAVALVSYEIGCGTYQGLIQLCVPWRFALSGTGHLAQHASDSADSLRTGAGQLPVKVAARIAQFKLSAKELATLQCGDVVMTEVSPHDEICLEINGAAVFRGSPGQDRNRKAIVLTTPVHAKPKTANSDDTPPETAVR